MLGENREEYLEAVYGILEEGSEVTPSEIGRRLGVKASSVTEMLKKLDSEGYVKWTPYGRIELTGRGFKAASKVKRKHRLLERFLYDLLKMTKGKVHEEACRMEHALSDEAAESLSRLMHDPSKCPDDGKKIPSRAEVNQASSLASLKAGDKAVVAYLEGGTEFKNRIRSVGVREGKTVEVVTREPFGGPYVVKIDGTTLSIGRGMASKVRIIEK